MLKKIKEATEYIKKTTNFSPPPPPPEYGIILGTGLGSLVSEISIEHSISYTNIPNFPTSTVEGHQGKLILGILGKKKVIAMQGRFHYYEGYDLNKITLPVRVMKLLGIKALLISNASGGVNPTFNIGDLMIINDHINLIPNPLIGENIDTLGPRFPDMSKPYCEKLIKKAEKIAKDYSIEIKKEYMLDLPVLL